MIDAASINICMLNEPVQKGNEQTSFVNSLGLYKAVSKPTKQVTGAAQLKEESDAMDMIRHLMSLHSTTSAEQAEQIGSLQARIEELTGGGEIIEVDIPPPDGDEDPGDEGPPPDGD